MMLDNLPSAGGMPGGVRRALALLRRLPIGLHAAHTAYFFILSAFPILALLLGLLRYTSYDAADLVALLEGFLPAALLPEAEVLIHSLYGSTSILGLSAVAALWSASRGMYGLLTGLNAIYGVSENRGYFATRLLSLLYTFAFVLVLLLTLVLHVFGTGLLELVRGQAHGFWRFALRIIDLRFFLLLGLQTAVFSALFMALPNRKNRLSDSLPGAFLASSGWLIFSHLFSVYVEHFPSYGSVYGSVYGVVMSMLWLYFCICILFYGGVLNACLCNNGRKA